MSPRERYVPGELPFRYDEPPTPADEPNTWWESWPFIASLGVIAAAIYVARSMGWLT